LPSGCTTNVFFKGEAKVVLKIGGCFDITFASKLLKESELNWKTEPDDSSS